MRPVTGLAAWPRFLQEFLLLSFFTTIILHPIIFIHKYRSFLYKSDKDRRLSQNLKLTYKKNILIDIKRIDIKEILYVK